MCAKDERFVKVLNISLKLNSGLGVINGNTCELNMNSYCTTKLKGCHKFHCVLACQKAVKLIH